MVGEIFERSVVDAPRQADGDVRLRIVSGAVMAVIALAANALGGVWFVLMILAAAVAMSWEWGQIVRGPEGLSLALLVHWAGIGLAAPLTFSGQAVAGLAVLAAAALAVFMVAPARKEVFSAGGVLYVGLPLVAIIWLRDDAVYGMLAVLLLFVIVWCTDTFAYVCGKLLRGPRLWPSLSRKKTWAGLIGGVVMASVGAMVFAHVMLPSSPLVLAIAGLVLGLVSQGGDLTESAIKRYFGVKNASSLIPGHGGVMDRMDGIVAAVLGAALFAVLVDPSSPARAVLLIP